MTQSFMYLWSKQDKNIIWRGSEWIILPEKSDSIVVTGRNKLEKMETL